MPTSRPSLSPSSVIGHAADAVPLHQFERFVDLVRGRERDRIDDHPALRALDPVDLRRLLLDAQVLVDDAHAALLGHRDGESVLGDRVHGGAENRHVQPDAAREPRGEVHLAGQHARVARHQQDVVEREGLRQPAGDLGRRTQSFSHGFLLRLGGTSSPPIPPYTLARVPRPCSGRPEQSSKGGDPVAPLRSCGSRASARSHPMRHGISCTSCRCRSSTGRCGRSSARHAARS